MPTTAKERQNLIRHAQWIVALVEGHSRDRKHLISSMTPDVVKAVATGIRLAHDRGEIDERWYRSRGRTLQRMMGAKVAVRNKHRMIETGAGLFKHALHGIGHALKEAGHAITHSKLGQSLITGAAGAIGDLGGPLGGMAASALTKSLLPKTGGKSPSQPPPGPAPAPMPPKPSAPPQRGAPSSAPKPPPTDDPFSGGGDF